jgi:signal transduction histidine kinase
LTQLLLYQLAREALANALKHAEARQVVVSLSREDGAIRLRISDDGRGFNPLLVDSANHFGLQLSRERTELAGGVMVVDTSPDGGTVVYRLPVE